MWPRPIRTIIQRLLLGVVPPGATDVLPVSARAPEHVNAVPGARAPAEPLYSQSMCFELDSVPPIPVLSGGAPVSSRDVTLEASDGNRFGAFLASPDEASEVGVVILPDVRGLYRFYEELALRFAERG